MGWLMWCYHLLCLQVVLFHSLSFANLCSHDQNSALLQFKQLFSFVESSSNDYSCVTQLHYPKMKYWEEETDCCSWDGVTCDMATGHVIGLDLSCSWLYGNIPSNSSLFLLSHLQKLNLAYNDFNFSQIPSDFVRFPSLTHLNLASSNFFGQVPFEISHLSQLVSLDLYGDLTLQIPFMEGLVQNLTKLEKLVLDGINMSTIAPSYLTNLSSSLTLLSLFDCELQGSFPDIFIKLTQLSFVDLSSNSLSGPIPSVAGGLQNLVQISLAENSLDGTIPPGLFSLPSLKMIDLSDNKLTGHIPEFQSKFLEIILLKNNRLYGSIPNSIFELLNLTHLWLFENNLSGPVELYMFAKFKNLRFLDVSYNNLSVSTQKIVNSSFSQLYYLSLSACNINEFPEILSTAKNLDKLYLDSNKIHGQIPNWLFNISTTLSVLSISHNFLNGFIERLPPLPTSLKFYSVSYNMFTGVIPSSFCNLSSLEYLDLSNNSLFGKVPQCLGNSTSISVLDLRMNNFHGSIPQTFAKSCSLTTLNLNNNRLGGPLPPSLVNCGNLKVLDLGNNMISDTFPHWLAALPDLQVLILRSNRFHGPLGNSTTRYSFSKLRILDLSHNGFTGPLQTKFFKNFEAMMVRKSSSAERTYMGDNYYKDIVTVTMKGVETTMGRILTIFSIMDLSCNKFQGQIPDVVGNLNSLILLNFSHNSLIGHIPLSLQNLTELESLDLSSNRLVGEISMQLSSLTFLSSLNLSYNQLVGPIPQVKQFNTYQNDSYIGNLGLCGSPLSKKCSNDKAAPESEPTRFPEEEDTGSWFDWRIIMMGYGSGLVIGLSMGYIVFSTKKPWWFVSMVERKTIKLSGSRRRRRN